MLIGFEPSMPPSQRPSLSVFRSMSQRSEPLPSETVKRPTEGVVHTGRLGLAKSLLQRLGQTLGSLILTGFACGVGEIQIRFDQFDFDQLEFFIEASQ